MPDQETSRLVEHYLRGRRNATSVFCTAMATYSDWTTEATERAGGSAKKALLLARGGGAPPRRYTSHMNKKQTTSELPEKKNKQTQLRHTKNMSINT